MFQKPTFGGTTTSGFGSFNSGTTTAAPFGGFKPATGAGAFSTTPAFGAAATTQPATGGLFGASNTSGGLFGGTASTSTGAWGSTPTGGFGFGSTANTGNTLFGNTTNTGLFSNANTSTAFGAKPPGFGFGATTSNTAAPAGGLFGTPPSTGTGLFGQQNNTLGGGGGLFSNTAGTFGQQQAVSGTAHVKYNPVVGTDVVVKSGTSQNINIKHHCITCMKEYENKSLEELRLEDYMAGRKGASNAGMFGGFNQPAENKPLFGATGGFGQPATTSTTSVFGGGGLTSGAGFGQTGAFSFGANAQNNASTGLFGANKTTFGATNTTGTGLFGAATTQAPTFGTNTSTFGFGNNTQTQQTGLFGAKPATSGFGTTSTPGFGGFGTNTGLFGNKPAQTQAPAFGTTTPAFGNMSGGFGTSTSAAGGGIFGNAGSFGKPATSQPGFGFGATQPTLGTGLGTGLGTNTFQTKPTTAPFGTLGSNTMFQPTATNNAFQINTGLGGGLFNTSTLGNTSFGGLGTPGIHIPGMTNNTLSGASASGNVHEQILNLVARPYGDSPLFKDLLPDSGSSADEALRPTNPAAIKAVLDRNQGPSYRVTSPTGIRLKLLPRTPLTQHKKSLFDGLEEADPTLDDKLCLKPSRKRLVLRSTSNDNSRNDSDLVPAHSNRSLEEPVHRDSVDTATSTDKGHAVDEGKHGGENGGVPDTRGADNLETSIDRHGSWLSSSKLPWSEKEKLEEEPSPRLYPLLDKEIQNQVSERRASWLTTKMLRKPLSSGNPDVAENSVRELCVRAEGGAGAAQDKENVNTSTVSEEEYVAPRDLPPHPSGVKLTRPGYYTIPSLDEMIAYMRPDGSCVVPHLVIGRKNYGNIYYDCEIDVAGLDLDSLVHFLNKEVIVYPNEEQKPPLGAALNRRAIVTLDRIWPRDKSQRKPITDPDRLLKMEYEGKLRRVCDKHDTKFIEYRPQTGSWVFRVEHFSKYGLTDSDDEDETTPDVMKRQLVNQQLQQSAPPVPAILPGALSATPGVPSAVPPNGVGLGGLSSLGGGPPQSGGMDGSLYAMQQTSLNLLSGASRAFEMDTTEDNADAQSFYQDNRAFGVKSPTSELARLEHRQSHSVQLMKASLYADTDREEDMSVSTGDQLVPMAVPTRALPASGTPTLVQQEDREDMETGVALDTEEQPMKLLIVRPHTVVLKYHRKVPPFKNTIAGRLDAAYFADMSVCRARHSRVGFGPSATLAYVTSYDTVNDLSRSTDLSSLGKYVRGRSGDDWSESVVVRMAIGQLDTTYNIQDVLSRHMETLLEHSTSNVISEEQCPLAKLDDSPSVRRQVLTAHVKHAAAMKGRRPAFGVSGAYCHEVWDLCEALWGADLDNGGVPGTDQLSVVNRHRKLLAWFAAAVADVTDEELSKPSEGEAEDEADGHSARVWTLLLGGRVLEACRVARENGDLNMATLIAQAAGDPAFRSLISRQLAQWRECDALQLLASRRVASLRLICGEGHSLRELHQLDWLRAMHATARYLCPQVPSLEQIVKRYERFFVADEEAAEDLELSAVGDEVAMRLPLPDYLNEYEIATNAKVQQRRVLDLRYELLRARALNTRPKLRPASYTADPFDYSLCFLLGTWFGNPSVESITGVADQLEAVGAWHLAVQALTYHPDAVARGHLIRGVLSRHAPAKVDSQETKSRLELMTKLGVPERWVLTAQAHRAKYEHNPKLEAEYLVAAGSWNAAHKVLLEDLLPEAVLADDLQSISPLLQRMCEASQRHEVSGWQTGGEALYHYLHVCDEIRGLVSSPEAQRDKWAVQARLEALRPRVAAACTALGGLQPKNARLSAARAEMGVRLVQLALAAEEPPARLAHLLRALKLPPDCTVHAHHKITTDLAEQASELCIESATSSPISSHHKATAAS